MAAPTVRPSQRKNNLSTLSLQEKTPKVTRKNILCPVSQEWPRVVKDVEDSILMKLTEKLTSSVNIVKHVNKSSVDDKSEKARIRSQLEIGTSGVFRALERDELACVLISGQATPAITVDHIISLAQDQGCPLLCLDQLAPVVAKATQSKCLPLAVGFKKIDNSHSEFADVISLVKSNTMTHSPQKKVNLCAAKFVTGWDSVELGRTNKYRPVVLSLDTGAEILGHLKKIFTKGLTGNTDKEKNMTKKKKKQKKKKNLKDSFEKAYHLQFDIGKRTVTSFLERGKYDMVLVSEEITPVLLAETQSFSLLSVAAEKKCPVVVLPGLVDAMRTLCGGSVSVLGLKKPSSFQGDEKYFKQVIDACLQAITNMNKQQLSPAEHQEFTGPSSSPGKPEASRTPCESCPGQEVLSISVDAGKADVQISQDVEDTNEKKRLHEKDSAETSTKNAVSDEDEELEDYSYLYVMKAESKELADVKDELKALTAGAGNDQFSADYISLSARSNEPGFQVTSSSRKQKGYSTKQKAKPTLASLSSDKPYTVVLDLGTVSKDTKCSEQQKDSYIPIEATKIFIHDTARSALSGGASVGAPLFTICRSGNPVSQSSSSETTPQQHNEGKLTASNKEDETLKVNASSQGQSETPLFTLCRSGNPVSRSCSAEATQQQQQNEDKLTASNKEDATMKVKASSQGQSETPFFTLSRSGNPVSQSSTVEATQKQQQHNEDKLTVSNKEDATMKVKASSEGQNETPFFTLSRSGNPVCLTQERTSKVSQQRRLHNDSQVTDNKEDKATLGVQELRASADTKYKGIDFLSLVEPGKDVKKAVKRKIQSDKSYISFAYTETNIQTMVSNPSKKKKKKKQKN